MIFPTTLINVTSTSTEASSKKSFLFDFTTGDFVVKDGKLKVSEGEEALKTWIGKVLRTQKDKYEIYESYGVKTLDLINGGYPQAFVESELKREIKEALLSNSEINSVTDFNFSRANRKLSCGFKVNSIYGIQEVSF
jgi:hypothetical protein